MSCSLDSAVNGILVIGVIALIAALVLAIMSSSKNNFTLEEVTAHVEKVRLYERERLARLLDFVRTADYPESLVINNFIDSIKGKLKK